MSSEVKSFSLSGDVYNFFATDHFSAVVHYQRSNHYERISPLRMNSVSEPVLFPDDTRVVITGRNLEDCFSVSNLFRSHVFDTY